VLGARPGCPNVGYSFTVTLSPGIHIVTVCAADTDATPDVGCGSVTVTNPLGTPAVWIDNPAQGAVVAGTVTISGWALDSLTAAGTPISKVQVKVDGNVVGNATYGLARPDVCNALPGRPGCPNVGFSYALNTASLSGSHVITACATDTDAAPDVGCSNSVTVTVSLGPPAVWIDSPVQGATVVGTVTVTGWALDNITAAGTPISSVQVKVDGNVVGNATYGNIARPDVCVAIGARPGCPNVGFSYALNTALLTAGVHTITACATDTDGTPDAACSNSVTVTVSIGPPKVWIDTPLQGQVVSGMLTVSGWALDNGTAVGTALSSVQVTVDGTVVFNATYGLSRADVCSALPRPGCPNVGFTYDLNTASWAAGTHTIVVTATDSDGTPDVGSASVTVTKP
jgi:hypothetical protein